MQHFQVLSSMRFDRKPVVPEGYELALKHANAIFHQARYDASARKLSFLKPLPAPFVNEFNGDLNFLGPDLPPSRALAFSQARLDPISMSACDGLACKEPFLPPHTQREAKPVCEDSCDRPSSHKSMQGDVWLGTDEKLFMPLAASELKLSFSPSPISECTLPLNVRPDNGFIMQLTSISDIKAVVPPLEQQDLACNSSLFILSPGKKRVLSPPLNNHPFKRPKRLDEPFSISSKAWFLFDNEIDGKLFSREDQCVKMPTLEAGQFRCIEREAQRSIVTGDSVCIKVEGNPNLIKLGNFQDPLHSEATTLAPLHVQDSEESPRDIDSSIGSAQVLIEVERARDTQVSMQSKPNTFASLQADICGIKPGRGLYTYNFKACMHPEPRVPMSPVDQESVIQQYSLEVCAVSTSHRMLLTSHSMLSTCGLRYMKAGSDSSKTPTLTKQLQREAKKMKEVRSSSKQSSSVVMAALTSSLLKFFQRAPTL